MTAAIFSHMTKFMEICISKIKTRVKGINKPGQNFAGHLTLQEYFEDITQISLQKNEKCYGIHHCALSLSALILKK